MSPDDSQRIRIALAVVALRHKREEQSITSLMVELHHRFSISDTDEAVSNKWMMRASILQGELEGLKRRYDMDLAELNLLRGRANEADKQALRGNIVTKKRRKLGKSGDRSLVSSPLPTVCLPPLSEADCAMLPRLNEPYMLFSAYHRLLATSKTCQRTNDHRLVAEASICAASEVLSALGTLLQPALALSGARDEEQASAIGCVDSVLDSMLPYVIFTGKDSLLPSDNDDLSLALEAFLGRLANDFVIPILKAFGPLSVRIYSSVLQWIKPSKKQTTRDTDRTAFFDYRQDLMDILQTILSALRKANGSAKICQQFFHVALSSALKELAKTYGSTSPLEIGTSSDLSASSTQLATLGCQQRVHRLARKDTAWYLSSAASACLLGLQNADASLDFISAEIDSAVTRILVCNTADFRSLTDRPLRSALALSDTERGFLMAIAEQTCKHPVHSEGM